VQEDFLHYVWQYKKFVIANLTRAAGELLTVVLAEQYLKEAGSEFFIAHLVPDSLVAFLSIIVAETNRDIEKFATFGVPAQDAFMNTSLVQRKQVYCNRGICMPCAIGLQFLKS